MASKTPLKQENKIYLQNICRHRSTLYAKENRNTIKTKTCRNIVTPLIPCFPTYVIAIGLRSPDEKKRDETQLSGFLPYTASTMKYGCIRMSRISLRTRAR